MFKFFVALIMMLYVSICGAVDLKKMDGAYPGFGCEQFVLYVYSAASESRDKGYALKDMIAWIDHDNNTIRGKPLSNALGQAYFDSMAEFLKSTTTEIWNHPEISAAELRDMARLNCEWFKGETADFVSFGVMYAIRQQSKELNLPKN